MGACAGLQLTQGELNSVPFPFAPSYNAQRDGYIVVRIRPRLPLLCSLLKLSPHTSSEVAAGR